MKSDSHREKSALTHPISEHPDGQPANISHGSGEPFHHTHPSDLRRFNRAAEPAETHHCLPEKSAYEIMSDAHREPHGTQREARTPPLNAQWTLTPPGIIEYPVDVCAAGRANNEPLRG